MLLKRIEYNVYHDAYRNDWLCFVSGISSWRERPQSWLRQSFALDTWHRIRGTTISAGLPIYLASDDPSVSREVAQKLGVKGVLSLSSSKDPHVRALASPRVYVQGEFNVLPEKDRIQQTKGIVVEFAMLSSMWSVPTEVSLDTVVCGMR